MLAGKGGNPAGSRGDRVKSNGVENDGGNNDDLGESLLIVLRRIDEDEDEEEDIGGGGGIGGAPIGKREERKGDGADDGKADGGRPNGGSRSGVGLRKRLRSSFGENVGKEDCEYGNSIDGDGKSIYERKKTSLSATGKLKMTHPHSM